MQPTVQQLLQAMIEYDAGDAKRIQHFLKVYLFASQIAEGEGLDAQTRYVTECAALVHDIGIHLCEKKYNGACHGALQEKEGPAEARALMQKLGFAPEVTERVACLVGRHHTYTGIDGVDCQILIEADFLVNLYEDDVPRSGVESAYKTIFRTRTGRDLCRLLYGIE